MSQLGLQFRPEPSVTDGEWTELEWTNGRLYRWRLGAFDLGDEFGDKAPGSARWELEVLSSSGEWRQVRHYARRDELWAHVRGEVVG